MNYLADVFAYLRFMKIPIWSNWEVFQDRIGHVAMVQRGSLKRHVLDPTFLMVDIQPK